MQKGSGGRVSHLCQGAADKKRVQHRRVILCVRQREAETQKREVGGTAATPALLVARAGGGPLRWRP